MGNPKQKWKPEEEEALKAGVAKHGTGKWKNIQKDPEFNHLLHSRSNIDLKDKWRNMTVAAGQVPREKSRMPKVRPSTDVPAAPVPKTEPSTSAEPVACNAPVMDGKNLLDEKCAAQYNAMILEALLALRDPNGSDAGAILNFIEQKHAVPSSFKRQLGSRLKKLMQEDKIEKVQNCFFRLKSMTHSGARTPMPKQIDTPAQEMQDDGYTSSDETLEEATDAAAYRVAEAENKSFLASEAMKEAERVTKMAEDAEALLMLAQEIFEQCSGGDYMLAV